jgi:hypothetical protein
LDGVIEAVVQIAGVGIELVFQIDKFAVHRAEQMLGDCNGSDQGQAVLLKQLICFALEREKRLEVFGVCDLDRTQGCQ